MSVTRATSIVLLLFVGGCFGGCSKKQHPLFDVAYANEWTFSIDGPVSGFVVVINTSDQPLTIDGIEATSVISDRAPSISVSTKQNTSHVLAPGAAIGALSGITASVFSSSKLVPEPIADKVDLLAIGLKNMHAGTYDVESSTTIRINGTSVELPITIHHIDSHDIHADATSARRVSVYR